MKTSVVQFFAKHRLFHKDGDNWRMTKRVPGHINGLPDGSHGILVCTNGILCYIERAAGRELFLGHLDWFIPDKEQTITDENGKVVEVVKIPRSTRLVNDALALLAS